MSDEKRFAVSNDDISRAILLTWRNRDDGGVTLTASERQRLEHIVGKMAGAIRTEPDRVDAATAALREIISGRDVLPTDAEALAHEHAHGRWLLRRVDGKMSLFDLAVAWVDPVLVARCWALDRDGKTCAWPVAEVTL